MAKVMCANCKRAIVRIECGCWSHEDTKNLYCGDPEDKLTAQPAHIGSSDDPSDSKPQGHS